MAVSRLGTDGRDSGKGDFHAVAVHVIGGLRTAIESLLMDVDFRASSLSELSEHLKISKNLAWKLSRVMNERDPMAVLSLVPGRDAFETLCKKAASRGASDETLRVLRESVRELHEFTESHAGDRATMQMMAAGCGSDQESSFALNHRKAAFVGNGFIWGVQVGVHYRLSVYGESTTQAGMIDLVTISALLSMRRTRPIKEWLISRSQTIGENTAHQSLPIDPAVHQDEPPLMTKFCTNPLPPIRSVPVAGGRIEHWMSEWPIGDANAISVVIGTVQPSLGYAVSTKTGHCAAAATRIVTPTEKLVFDFFVDREVFGDSPVQSTIMNDLGMLPLSEVTSTRVMQLPTEVVRLGRGVRRTACREVPIAQELAKAAFDRLGYDDDRFELHRMELRYPPIAVCAIMECPLPT